MYMHNHNTVVFLLYHADRWGDVLVEGATTSAPRELPGGSDPNPICVAYVRAPHARPPQ